MEYEWHIEVYASLHNSNSLTLNNTYIFSFIISCVCSVFIITPCLWTCYYAGKE